MKPIIVFIVVGAAIQSFLHSTNGTIHAFEKTIGGLYSLISVVLTIYSTIKYGIRNILIIPLIFFASNFVFVTIFDKLFKRKK